jgi:hypothetical protein
MVHEGLCQVEKFEYVKCNIQYSMPEGQSLDKAKSTKSSLADYFLVSFPSVYGISRRFV